jgi:hypothetical protein
MLLITNRRITMKIKHNLYFAPHAQTCRNNITPTTLIQDFTLHDDGTVTHNKTGLMWMRCALGQNWNGATCTGSGQTYIWQAALQAAEGSSFAGHGDWRLPNIKAAWQHCRTGLRQPCN